jgi:hypothetical protein
MRGLFSLEAAKEEMGVRQAVEECVAEAQEDYLAEHGPRTLRHIPCEAETLWSKVDHLLYLPILGLTRPRDLYYDQRDGLKSLYSFTYKYLTVEHFLGQLTRLRVGCPLAQTLAHCYAQAWYPDQPSLYLFVDWHIKPHWTKAYSHAGHVTMWGRTLPGTKQLMLNGTEGEILGGWNYPIDAHLTHVLVDLEAELSQTLQREIDCTIVDGEGGGQPLAERYAEADRFYISVLPRHHDHSLADFALEGAWCPVVDDPHREAVFARWADPKKAVQDLRRFVLLRPVGQREPTRVYSGRFRPDMLACVVPWLHRRRWPHNERRIRDLIQGANLNANYGYTYGYVPNRTRQRQWNDAQARVEVIERKASQQQEAIRNLRQQLAQLERKHAQECAQWTKCIVQQRADLLRRQHSGRPTKRCHNRLTRLRQQREEAIRRFRRRERTLWQRLVQHQARMTHLRGQLTQRQAARDVIDTDTLCRERHLQKDQIMLDFQVLLGNLHDWVRQHYLAPQWKTLSLEKATQMIYRKSGRLTWYPHRIEIVLDAYAYRDQQQAMEVTCRRFNEVKPRWRDGRLLCISVADP